MGSNECVFPTCTNRRPDFSLYKIPSKAFYGGEKREWAEKLEKMVRSCREDRNLERILKRDQMHVCEVHFIETDFEMKG